jgi:hypothetical protein
MVYVMKWEYRTLKFGTTTSWSGGKFDTDMFNQKLNELGEEDWELVSIFDTNYGQGATRDVVAVFKRSRSSTRLA